VIGLGTIIEIIKKPVILGIPNSIDLTVLVGRRITGTRESNGYLIDGSELVRELRTIKGLTKEVKMLKQQKIDRIKLFISLEYCEAVFQ
jgi:hypothetical protein